MPYEVDVLPEHHLGVARLFDAVTGDTIVQAIRALYTSRTWKPTFDVVWDARETSKLMVSRSEAADILDQVRHLERRIGEGRTAMVVRNESDFALFQMLFFKTDTSIRERKMFYSLEDALSWVDAPEALG